MKACQEIVRRIIPQPEIKISVSTWRKKNPSSVRNESQQQE
jgi:hypothetical protein